jgi:tetratricopeptide (TPR) repeat protein
MIRRELMPPLPLPHRVSFVYPSLVLAKSEDHLSLLAAKLLVAATFDYLVWHPVVAIGDIDDERITDPDGVPLDVQHPGFEDTLDWYFTVARRDEVLWWDLSLADAINPQRQNAVRLCCARADGGRDDFASLAGESLSDQLTQCLAQWLASRHLPMLPEPMPRFWVGDVVNVMYQLDRLLVAARDGAAVSDELLEPPPRLASAFYHAAQDLSSLDPHLLDEKILAVDPRHPVARRNLYLRDVLADPGARREILPLAAEVPMFGKPHLSIWGKDFKDDRKVEKMGLRHQGLAAMLLPANPWANSNYALQLEEVNRKEEAYRWADRATIASPSFYQAHLQAVRLRRQTLRHGEAFLEAQRRCNTILDRWKAGRIAPTEWHHRYHAGMQLAMVRHDVGRLDEAIQLAERTLADLDDPAAGQESFVWAIDKLEEWKTDPLVLANSYAYEGYFRNDPGRVLAGFARGDIATSDDVAMYIDALIALGREDLALLAFAHHEGCEITGGGKARLAGAKVHILCGDLEQALDHLQVCQLRFSQSKLEAEINRVLRLAVTRPVADWEAVVQRRLDRGALRLARNAARDLADFVPGLETSAVFRQALTGGAPYVAWELDDGWLEPVRAAAAPASATALDMRLQLPHEATLRAADQLAQNWWSGLAPAGKKEERAHGALYAFTLALSRYFSLISQAPNPLAGAYRHIATEALQILHQCRFAVEDNAIRAALELFDRIAGRGVDEWQLDWWLLRFERALELDTSYGALLNALTDGLPRVRELLRGDERIGFELRMAFDLKEDPDSLDPARVLFERCQRAMETGAAAVQWSELADATLPPAEALDVHWTCTLANPGNHAGPWVNAASGAFARGRVEDALRALTWGFRPTSAEWRKVKLAKLEPTWRAAGLDVPFDFAAAQAQGLEALQRGELALALRSFQWCDAVDPKNSVVKQNLGMTYAMMGKVYEAVRELSAAEGDEGPKKAGHALLQHQRHAEAARAYHYASLRFDDADDWRLLATAAWFAEDDGLAALAYEKMLAASPAAIDAQALHGYAVALNAIGQYARAEQTARQLLALSRDDATFYSTGMHSLARALLGLGRGAEAMQYAQEALRINPLPENAAELGETLARCQRQDPWPVKVGKESSVERRAFDAVAGGDFATAEQLAIEGNSWGLFRAALAASEFRAESENDLPVTGKALGAAEMVIDRTLGVPLPDAALCRIRALRIRENAYVQIDPPPPMGSRMTEAQFRVALAERDDDEPTDIQRSAPVLAPQAVDRANR